MPATRRHRLCAVLALAAVAVVAACSSASDDTAQPTSAPRAGSSAPRAGSSAPAASSPTDEKPAPEIRHVVAVSVDGLHTEALERLGRDRTPILWRMIDEGASTLNARTARELTLTLPNHTGMLTGRRVRAAGGGHGVEVNHDPGGTVHDLAGERVSSVFDALDDAGLSSAVYASKNKFALFDRSWPAIDDYRFDADNAQLTAEAAQGLARDPDAFTFVHLSGPDQVGHDSRWLTPAYLEAVEQADDHIGELLSAVEAGPRLRRSTVLIVTADHGGEGLAHGDTNDPDNFTIPFLALGPGVPAGADLYDLNPTRKQPDADRNPSYRADGQPIRNGDLANLVSDLLDAEPVPGSRFGAQRPVRVR